ncbi:hypothetical protein [Colwellia psychrerythraea]|uniref:Uncharacterized protein n=1 Tax=Colwellia psychrerythraea TaxID=28229 RepID=A0A099KSJ8_COLPS|nr:hypothetical protein [Colwellia psychrerythraea]KGJ93749.1 hypothetical protein GAB14E_2304 [Colwellia psychrerythraea]
MKKIVVLLLLCVGLIYTWKGVTPDKRPDWFVKFVQTIKFTNKSLAIDIDEDINASENMLLEKFDHLYFACRTVASSLGDRQCWSYISHFNEIPANSFDMYFKNDRLNSVGVYFDTQNYDEFRSYLNKNFSYVGFAPNPTNNNKIVVWFSKTSQIGLLSEKPVNKETTHIFIKKHDRLE